MLTTSTPHSIRFSKELSVLTRYRAGRIRRHESGQMSSTDRIPQLVVLRKQLPCLIEIGIRIRPERDMPGPEIRDRLARPAHSRPAMRIIHEQHRYTAAFKPPCGRCITVGGAERVVGVHC